MNGHSTGTFCERTDGKRDLMEAEAEVPEPAITEAQWGAAQEAFEDGLPDTAGIPTERHALILKVLSQWDERTPAERRTMGGGNEHYWYKKYCVSREGEGGTCELLHRPEPGGMPTLVSHQGRMFADIRAVHCDSARTAHRPPLHSACALLPSRA